MIIELLLSIIFVVLKMILAFLEIVLTLLLIDQNSD